MEINWNFNEIIKEIERVKELKPRNSTEEISKYLQLESLADVLFTRSANDRELYEGINAKENLIIVKDYMDKNKRITKKMIRHINKSAEESLLEFMFITKDSSLRDTTIDIQNPAIEKYINKLSIEDIIKIGDDFFNTIPFLEKNFLSNTVDKGYLSLTSSDKTIYTANVGKLYPTGHILSTYREDIYLNSLINIISSYSRSIDLESESNFLNKRLKADNLYVTFFPKLMELLSYDFVLEKNKGFDKDINLSKSKLMNNYNVNLERTLNLLTNSIVAPEVDEKEYYNTIIHSLETELSTPELILKLKSLKEKLKNPILFIPPLFGDEMRFKYPLASYANDVLDSGTKLLGTLLALKFYYLIKEDQEKGLDLLEKVYNDLIINNKNNSYILKQYGLDDYLSPEYIQQYNNDYNQENNKIYSK